MAVLLVTVRLEEGDRKALREVAGRGTEVLTLEELGDSSRDVLPEVEVVLCAGLRDIGTSDIERMKSLRMVQTLLAGADHLPAEVFRPEVAVCTGAGAASHDIAEHALALLLAAAKNVVQHSNAISNGRFDRSLANLTMRGRVLGVLGLGNVGTIVARQCKDLGMEVMAINRSGDTAEDVDFVGTLDDLEHVLRESDYLVLCLPLTSRTEGIIGRKELETMKGDSILVNVGRGALVREKDLYEHMLSHPAFRAAFDVWWRYPSSEEGRPFTQPFHELKNFIATPHVAGHVPGHREAMMALAIENIGNFYMGRVLMNRIVQETPKGME